MAETQTLLRFGSERHKTILSALRERHRLADEQVSKTHSRWRENEERYLAYLPATEEDKVLEAKRTAGEGPQTTTLVVPMSYALMMTWHTYMVSVMLGRAPVHQWEGRTARGENGKIALESVIDYQTRVGGHLVPYYVWMLDTGKYGMGVLGNYWDNETSYITERVEVPMTFAGLPVPGKSKTQNQIRKVPGYEGNRVYNIHPSKVWADPRVPLMEYQRGEFFIVDLGSVSRHEILSDPDRFFNLDVAKKFDKSGNVTEEIRSSQVEWPAETEAYEPHKAESVGSFQPREYYVRLVPKHWQLGENQDREIWVFTVLGDHVIVGAEPLGSYSNKFPFQIAEHEPDGHQLTKRSFLEIVGPLQDFMDWLINTHRLNVAKAINDTLIVDPSLVYMSDVREPLPGKLIRAKPRAYGQGILDKAVHQLKVTDITQQHLGTMSVVQQMMQRVSGVTEQVMGMLEQRGRPTATGSRINATFGVNRLKTEAEYISAAAMQPHAQMLLQNTQQWMSDAIELRIVGDSMSFSNAQQLERFVNVSPEDIRGFYDYVPVDGSLPVDRQAQGQTLMMLMSQMGKVPGVLASYDMGGLFGWIGEMMGAKGMKNFKLQLTPDEVAMKQLSDGNLIPQGEVGNGVGTSAVDGAFFPPGGPGGSGPSDGASETGGAAPGEENLAGAGN